jgi:dihydroorotate dehydrogenase
VAEDFKVDGYVVANTSSERKNLRGDPAAVRALGPGGLSGRPLDLRSTELIRAVYAATGRKPVIGVGGIFSAADAYEKIRAGASLVEFFTGLIYEGPLLVRRINRGLAGLLKRDGYSSVAQAVGTGV